MTMLTARERAAQLNEVEAAFWNPANVGTARYAAEKLAASDAARDAALTHLQGLVRAFQQADAAYLAVNTFNDGASLEWVTARANRKAALQALAAYEAPHA